LLAPIARRIPAARAPQGQKPNILIVVFDAWAAQNMSLYGYERETTPQLTRLAERAIVYHNHYAAGNYTTPGTASLLTGLYPWTHRAMRFLNPVAKSMEGRSIFHAFPDFHRVAYTHNPVAEALLSQFEPALDHHLPLDALLSRGVSPVLKLLGNDGDAASLSKMRIIDRQENGGYGRSLFLSEMYRDRPPRRVLERQADFPRGVPFFDSEKLYFFLEDAVDFLVPLVADGPRPFVAYFHFLPPHEPYRTHKDFYGRFQDDYYVPIEKPHDLFGRTRDTVRSLARERRHYDEFVLYVDREFSRLHQMLEEAGVLQDTWLLLTSDHGEMFERGIAQHQTPVLYQPVIRVPLLIFEPGRTVRLDIHTPTSATDILPTLQGMAGAQTQGWGEGTVLPPWGPVDDQRNVYAVEAKTNPGDLPLGRATTMLVRGEYKLCRFDGYPALEAGSQRVELYNLSEDPEELHNLYPSRPRIGQEMLDALNQKLAEVDAPYV
jgi:choline-sulfatase